MHDRREVRSGSKGEALRLLLESVLRRSDASAIAVIDGRGLVVSGAGNDRDLRILGAVAEPAAFGSLNETCERLTEGTDILARVIETSSGTMFLAALGNRVSRMPEAVRGIERIMNRAS
jgi:hypothetical protein